MSIVRQVDLNGRTLLYVDTGDSSIQSDASSVQVLAYERLTLEHTRNNSNNKGRRGLIVGLLNTLHCNGSTAAATAAVVTTQGIIDTYKYNQKESPPFLVSVAGEFLLAAEPSKPCCCCCRLRHYHTPLYTVL